LVTLHTALINNLQLLYPVCKKERRKEPQGWEGEIAERGRWTKIERRRYICSIKV